MRMLCMDCLILFFIFLKQTLNFLAQASLELTMLPNGPQTHKPEMILLSQLLSAATTGMDLYAFIYQLTGKLLSNLTLKNIKINN